jgi:hypothetical protein
MDNVFIYLGTCDTCRRVWDELGPKAQHLQRRELKGVPLTGPELDALKELRPGDPATPPPSRRERRPGPDASPP